MMKKFMYILLLVMLAFSLVVFSLPKGGCQLAREEVTTAEEQVLNLYGIDPLTLDPAISGETTSHSYVMQLFSGLICLDGDLETVPDIAERWDISSDGRTYTFYLRQGVRFHNGREVKAEDFKYSWQRACAPVTQSITAATYLGDVVGVREVLDGESEEIAGVKVVGDYTFQVTIDAPKSHFLSKLTYPTTFVVDRTNVELGGEWWRKPIGTGPFRLNQWDENSLLVLEKNELYYGKLAEVDFVIFYLWGGVPMNMYETGKTDVANVNLNYIDKVTNEAGPFYKELAILPELSFSYISFDCTKPPFDDVNIRRAFCQAIDKDKLVSLVFRDMVRGTDGILPPGMPGFNEDLSGWDYNVGRARQLIDNSEYGDVSELPPITITTAGWGGLVSQGLEAIIQEWRNNLGVEVRVRQLEQKRFLYHLKQERDEMFYMRWVADYPHPQNFLDILFRSGADNNYGEYDNAEIDSLLDVASVEPDNELSLSLYQEVEQKLVEDAACLPLWFGQNYILVKPYVKGYELNPLGFAILNNVSIGSH